MAMKMTLEGIICALITPLTEQEKIDERGVDKLLERVVGGGIKTLLALGSTGEQATLRDAEKRRLLQVVKNAMPAGVALIVGTGDTGTLRAIDNAKMAQDAGADGIVVGALIPACCSAAITRARTSRSTAHCWLPGHLTTIW